jgi:hypothetical protein
VLLAAGLSDKSGKGEDAMKASLLQLFGAGCFGALIGWYVYFINRYRKGQVQLSDLVTLIGVIGGGAVLALFKPETDLFGAYGIGLAIGFFGYFVVLNILVQVSSNFSVDWFLDGRRKIAKDPWEIPDYVAPSPRPMDRPGGGAPPVNP